MVACHACHGLKAVIGSSGQAVPFPFPFPFGQQPTLTQRAGLGARRAANSAATHGIRAQALNIALNFQSLVTIDLALFILSCPFGP